MEIKISNPLFSISFDVLSQIEMKGFEKFINELKR